MKDDLSIRNLAEYLERIRFNHNLSENDMIVNLNIRKQTCRKLIKHMIFNKVIIVDITKRINYSNLKVIDCDLEKMELMF